MARPMLHRVQGHAEREAASGSSWMVKLSTEEIRALPAFEHDLLCGRSKKAQTIAGSKLSCASGASARPVNAGCRMPDAGALSGRTYSPDSSQRPCFASNWAGT